MACGGHGDDEFHAPVCDVVFSIFIIFNNFNISDNV
jgi:hypothetical protein